MNFTTQETDRILKVKEGIGNALAKSFHELEDMPGGVEISRFIRDNFVVSGGISASIFHHTDIKDIDLYYANSIAVADLNAELAKLFIDKDAPYQHLVKEINPKYLQGEVNGKLITVNAITLKNNMQLIRLANITECQKIFDFKHCLPVFDLGKNIYKISRNSYDSLNSKLLMTHHGQPKPHRLEKFRQRGWSFK